MGLARYGNSSRIARIEKGAYGSRYLGTDILRLMSPPGLEPVTCLLPEWRLNHYAKHPF